MSKGLIEFGRKRYEQAAALFRRAADAKPNDFDARDYLGQTLLRLRQYEAAETIFQKLVDVDPSSGRALLGLGIARSYLGKYDEALANLKAAERALPDNPLVYYYQGLVYHQLRAFDLSPALFSRAMALGAYFGEIGTGSGGIRTPFRGIRTGRSEATRAELLV
jgi:tetratricopeptide (TPR) repeat protein